MVLIQHADVFQGLEKFPGPPMRLHLKEDYIAASRGICKVHVNMEKEFAEEVQNMMNQGIIRRMRDDEHSEWVILYVLVTMKALNSMPEMTNSSEMTNLSAMNSTPENIVSAEKLGEQMFQPRGLGYA